MYLNGHLMRHDLPSNAAIIWSLHIYVYFGFYTVWKRLLWKNMFWGNWTWTWCIGQRLWTVVEYVSFLHNCTLHSKYVFVNCLPIVLPHWMYESNFTVMYICTLEPLYLSDNPKLALYQVCLVWYQSLQPADWRRRSVEKARWRLAWLASPSHMATTWCPLKTRLHFTWHESRESISVERLPTGQCLVMITIINYSYHHQAGPVDFETLVRNLARVRGSKLLQQVPGEREATEQLA